MHDPNTVAFEIKNPFVRKRDGYRPSLITIWHRDKGGVDGACGWPCAHLTKEEAEYGERLITNKHDNLKHWFPNTHEWEQIARVKQMFRLFKTLHRPWFKHPRWHFWHWRFQVHPYQKLMRGFERCAWCHGRFGYGYQSVTSAGGRYHSACLTSKTERDREERTVEQAKHILNTVTP